MFPQHSTSSSSSPLPFFHSVLPPAPPLALTCLYTAWTAELKRGNIQAHGPPICLPWAGQRRDWLRGLTCHWLWIIHPKYDWLWLAEGLGRGGLCLKLGGDSWLLKQCFKGHRDGLRQRTCNNDIPVKWPKWEALPGYALCLLCLVQQVSLFVLCTPCTY